MNELQEKGWLEDKAEDPEFQCLRAREDFIEDFLTQVEQLMRMQGITRIELARRMGWRPFHITQLFRRTRSLTAAAMSDLIFHLGARLQHHVKQAPATTEVTK